MNNIARLDESCIVYNVYVQSINTILYNVHCTLTVHKSVYDVVCLLKLSTTYIYIIYTFTHNISPRPVSLISRSVNDDDSSDR